MNEDTCIMLTVIGVAMCIASVFITGILKDDITYKCDYKVVERGECRGVEAVYCLVKGGSDE